MSEDTVEQMEVDLGNGVKAMLSKEDGQKFIANRDDKSKAFNSLQAQLQAQSDAEAGAADKAKQEEERRIAVEAAQKGELDLLNNHHTANVAKLNQELLGVSIEAELGKRKDMVISALPDVSAMLANNPEIVRENGKSVHKSATGVIQPLSAYVDTWLTERPHYKSSTIPAKQGGDADKEIPAGVDVITREEYNKSPGRYASKLASKKLIVKD